MMFSSQIDAFSPSQFTPSQNAAADSTTPSKFRGASSTTPLTVKQIAAAQLVGAGEKDVPFVVHGVETANIRVVGIVSRKAERATDVSFTLDDGTGCIDFVRWVNDAADSAETAAIQNGMYVSVIGTLKGLQDKKRATAFCVRPVTDYSEVPLHFTQCVRMHMEYTKSIVGSPAHNNSDDGTPFSNRIGEARTPTSLKSNLPLLTSGTIGSATDLYTQVMNVFGEPASIESDHGLHIDEIAKRLTLPADKIKEAIDFHVNCGHIFCTIDDFHFKPAVGTPFFNSLKEGIIPTSLTSNPPPVTSGTNGLNGPGTNLYRQVLNVISEPASNESDHGVHIDEIAKRLKLPVGKIKEGIDFHVYVGHIYPTIDDFHFKSAIIPTSLKSNPVLNVISEPASNQSDHGVHIDEISKRLRLPVGKIKEAIDFHVYVGHIYPTIDDFHFKSAIIPTSLKSNPPPVTSRMNGLNGPGTNLYTQVLNVISEPASNESDYGVHMDEIAKRLRLPVGKIKEAIGFHVDVGHIYHTIDDFHFKSALID